jgi:hypothetical protein
MARSDKDNSLISYKVSKLQREGMGLKQARAVAFRMYREGELMGTGRYAKPKKRKAPSPSRTRRSPSRTRRR